MENKKILFEKIIDLLQKPIYTALEVYSKGNKLYLLKDRNNTLYLLLVPQRPLEDTFSKKVVDIGFKEIWKGVNYELYIDNTNKKELFQLCENIEYLFNDLLRVEFSRPWRYEINSGMGVLKNNRKPLATTSERHSRKKKSKQIMPLLFNDYAYTMYLSILIIIGMLDKAIIIKIDLKITLIILIFSFLIVKLFRIFRLPYFVNFRKRKFINHENTEFFTNHGFSKVGERFQGNIKGYKVELFYSVSKQYIIIVYHKKISWNRVLELPTNCILSKTNYNWTGMFYSQKNIQKWISNDELLSEANTFVDDIISYKIEKEETTANNC